MKKPNDDVLIQYLTKRPNLPYTLDILRQGDEIRRRVLGDFWQAILDNLRKSTPKSLASQSLSFDLYDDPKKMDDKYSGLTCCKSCDSEQAQHLSFTVQHYCTPSTYELTFGLAWAKKQPVKSKLFSLPEVQKLFQHLNENKFRRTQWWLGWKEILKDESRDAFLLKYAKDGESIPQQVQESFWPFVEETFEMVRRANRAIRSAASK